MSGPAKYRKLPVEIEAMQVPGPDDLPAWGELAAWIMVNAGADSVEVGGPDGRRGVDHLLIHTLEGTMRAEVGDWIIRGVQGEFYPCKPDIFAATYEPASVPADVVVIPRDAIPDGLIETLCSGHDPMHSLGNGCPGCDAARLLSGGSPAAPEGGVS